MTQLLQKKAPGRMPLGSCVGRIPAKEAGPFIGCVELCRCGKPFNYYWNGKRYYGRCHPCERKARTPEQTLQCSARNRKWLLNARYGIDVAQYDALLQSQGGKCAICSCATPGGIGKVGHDGVKKWHVDHCHETGAVRGLLCGDCNKGLGQFKDSALRLQQAIDYLNGGNRDLVRAVLNSADEKPASC